MEPVPVTSPIPPQFGTPIRLESKDIDLMRFGNFSTKNHFLYCLGELEDNLQKTLKEEHEVLFEEWKKKYTRRKTV